jgi:RND family efflux transporter MFP subunit
MKPIIIAAALCGLALIGCKHSHNHDSEEDGHAREESAEGAIHFHKEMQEKIDFAVENPVREQFGQVIKTTAQIISSPEDEAIISARMSGVAVFTGGNTQEGQAVGAGQTLFSISGEGFAEGDFKTKFAEVFSGFQKAESDYGRAKSLKENKIMSDKEFIAVENEYKKAKAQYDNLTKNFGENGQKVAVPFAGFIRRIFAANGQYVEAGQPLAAISKNRSLTIRAEVRRKYAPLLPNLATATITAGGKTYSLEELNGKILSYGKSLDADSYMLPVSISIDNNADFLTGDFVEIALKTRSTQPVLTVPASALIEEQGVYFVFVQLSDEEFEKREIAVGQSDGIRVEVLSGLSEKDKIVARGAISVKLAQSAGALDPHAGHVH